jgi:hypothetical protein
MEPTTPYEEGIFFSFDTEKKLLDVVKRDLLDFCEIESEDLDTAQIALNKIVSQSIDHIDNLHLKEFNASIYMWKISYLGTLDTLINGSDEPEKAIRKKFRHFLMVDESDKEIKLSELESFKNFLLPEWLQ